MKMYNVQSCAGNIEWGFPTRDEPNKNTVCNLIVLVLEASRGGPVDQWSRAVEGG